jgi:hypothetical protein
MEAFLKFLGVFALSFVAIVVTAWGYQVFWNEAVLNVWQLYTTNDVINTMNVSYSTCVAIVVGLGLIKRSNPDNDKDFEERISDAVDNIIAKLMWIGVVILTVSIIF